MKKLLLSVALMMVVPAVVSADDDWFDMQNCDICKCMAKNMDVMMEMKWETHKIADGMMMIAVIPEKHKKTMEKAHEEMMHVIAKMEKGAKTHMCGFCTSYGGLKQAGAKFEELETVGGKVTLVTSNEPELVEKIHTHADKTIAAHKKMMKEMAAQKSE